MTTRMPRLTPDVLDGDQLALYRAIAEGPRAQGRQFFALRDPDGALRGPFQTFLLSPALGESIQQLGSAIRFSTELTPRIRELAILAVAAAMGSQFEWDSHHPIAEFAGLRDLAALARGDEPAGLDRDEALALRVARRSLEGDIQDDLWSEAQEALGRARLFEIVALTGYYRMLAVQLRVFRIDDGSLGVSS